MGVVGVISPFNFPPMPIQSLASMAGRRPHAPAIEVRLCWQLGKNARERAPLPSDRI